MRTKVDRAVQMGHPGVILPLKNEDDLPVGFVDLVQCHHIGVCFGQLQHGYLV